MGSRASRDEQEKKYRVPALEKGLHLLETLSAAALPLTLTELAHAMGRTSSELFRLLVCLEEQGYVYKDDHTGAYSLTLKLFELAHAHPPVADLLRVAGEPMGTLARDLHESVHLSVIRHGKLVILSEALSPAPVRLSVATGGAFSPVRTSSGRLLLAHWDENRLRQFLAGNEDYASLTAAQQEDLAETLDTIRRTGVSTSENENLMGVCDAAVLIGHSEGGVQAALAITWLSEVSCDDRRADIVSALLTCAKQITTSMGIAA